MLAAKFNILAEQGAKLNLTFVWKDKDGVVVDLTTYDMRMNISPAYGTAQVKYGTWVASTTTQAGDIKIGPSDIGTPDGSDGKVVISIAASVLSTWTYNDYVYIVELTAADGITVSRLAQGLFSVSKEIPNS
jgi:hypothetical protein